MMTSSPARAFVLCAHSTIKNLPSLFLIFSALTSTSCSREKEASDIAVVDTHIHLYDLDRLPGLPWPEKDDKFLYRSTLASDYNKVIAQNNLAGVLVVEASPRVSDNDWILHHTKPYQDKYLGLIGHLEFDQTTFKDDLARLCGDKRFLGLRIGTQYLDKPHNPDYLSNETVLDNLQLLSDSGKTLDVLIFKLGIDDAVFIARKYPKLKVIINHIGNAKIDGKSPDAQWVNQMKSASGCPNMYCKVSSLIPQSINPAASKDSLHYERVLNTVYDLFGEDRIIFGSNWPCTIVCGDFSEHLKVVNDFFAPKGPAVLEKFYHKNAELFYGFRLN